MSIHLGCSCLSFAFILTSCLILQNAKKFDVSILEIRIQNLNVTFLKWHCLLLASNLCCRLVFILIWCCHVSFEQIISAQPSLDSHLPKCFAFDNHHISVSARGFSDTHQCIHGTSQFWDDLGKSWQWWIISMSYWQSQFFQHCHFHSTFKRGKNSIVSV